MQLTVNIQQWVGIGSLPIPLVVDSGQIIVGTETNALAGSQVVATVTNGESVSISVIQAGYLPYEVAITSVYTTDKEINILLVDNITLITDPEYLMPHPYFFTFQDNCSFTSDSYVASSYLGEYKWYVNNVCVQEGGYRLRSAPTSPGVYQIKLGSETQRAVQVDACTTIYELAWVRQWAGNVVLETGNPAIGLNLTTAEIDAYFLLDLETNVEEAEYRPTISLEVDGPVDALTSLDCYALGEDITVTPFISLTRVGADPVLHTATWKVVDPQGAIVYEEELALTNLVPLVFTILDVGTYAVSLVLDDTDCCCAEYTVNTTVETCDFISLVPTGNCGEFTLCNVSTRYSLSYTVNLIDGSVQEVEGDLTQVSCAMFQLSEIGIHSVNIIAYPVDAESTEDPIELTYVINNWCELWDCLAEYINALLCAPRDSCDPCPDGDLLNEMLMLNMTYGMLMNKEYSFNRVYSGLDESKLAEYQTINSVGDRIKTLCSRLDCSGICTTVTNPVKQFAFGLSSANNTTNGSGGCGCGGNCGSCS